MYINSIINCKDIKVDCLKTFQMFSEQYNSKMGFPQTKIWLMLDVPYGIYFNPYYKNQDKLDNYSINILCVMTMKWREDKKITSIIE